MVLPMSASVPCRTPQSSGFISDYSLPGSNTSPLVQSRYSVHSLKRRPFDGEAAMSASIEMTQIQTQQWNTIRHSLWMLSAMAISAALMTMLALEFFLLSERKDPIERRILEQYTAISEVLTEISYCLDVSACLVSLAAFFSASFQIFFTLNLIRAQPNDLNAALGFLQNTSFIRVIVFAFWFTSVLLFLGVLCVYVVTSPFRGAPSKGISISLALFLLLILILSVIKSVIYWARNSTKSTDISSYSTLV
ncbi:unnamed protein product, partial [Mesorhabditis belari]|uniref:Transmembrane protein n=1 Tax=Mesorhabditis belari TaxID=2138241 RepID=A0AAF3EIZ8_9BILA